MKAKHQGRRLLGRIALLVLVFGATGVFTARRVADHAARNGATGLPLRLAAAMAGLFAGSAAALLTGIGMAAMGRDKNEPRGL